MSNPIIYIKPIKIIHEDLTEEFGIEVTLEFDVDTVVYNYDSKGKEISEVYDTEDLGKDAVIHKELSMFS